VITIGDEVIDVDNCDSQTSESTATTELFLKIKQKPHVVMISLLLLLLVVVVVVVVAVVVVAAAAGSSLRKHKRSHKTSKKHRVTLSSSAVGPSHNT